MRIWRSLKHGSFIVRHKVAGKLHRQTVTKNFWYIQFLRLYMYGAQMYRMVRQSDILDLVATQKKLYGVTQKRVSMSWRARLMEATTSARQQLIYITDSLEYVMRPGISGCQWHGIYDHFLVYLTVTHFSHCWFQPLSENMRMPAPLHHTPT